MRLKTDCYAGVMITAAASPKPPGQDPLALLSASHWRCHDNGIVLAERPHVNVMFGCFPAAGRPVDLVRYLGAETVERHARRRIATIITVAGALRATRAAL